MPRVSIVMPAYNPNRAFLLEALQSVAAQTYSDWEALVVDDGSATDLSYVNGVHPSIRLVRQANQGPAGARNTGIRSSTGEFVAFIDADDLWAPTKLALQTAALDANLEARFCHTQWDRIDEHGDLIAANGSQPIRSYHHALTGCWILTSSVMIRRDTLEQVGLFDTTIWGAEDWDMWLKLVELGSPVFVSSSETRYREHSGEITSNSLRMYSNVLKVLSARRAKARQAGDSEALRIIDQAIRDNAGFYAVRAYDEARRHLADKAFGKFWQKYWFAVKRRPIFTLEASAKYVAGRLTGRRA